MHLCTFIQSHLIIRLLLLLSFFISLYADTAPTLLYQQKSTTLDLAHSPYWQLLLHMNDNTSEIDGEHFFLSPDGKHNPQAELNATIKALYSDNNREDDNATGCRYPARRAWLEDVLTISDFPSLTCKRLNTMLKLVDPQSATFVFPAAHINSPASMFGHTFLRIDSSYESKLLSHAINYSATADQNKENGVLFAIKGLLGGYSGVYSLLPYYDKLKEYRDSDQRDIWEYNLNLTTAEVTRLLLHVWELQDTYSWYYFFDENCSYNMLWLLEIARPSVHLREYFTYQVLPIETVFAIEGEGLLLSKGFRPSLRTKLLAYEEKLGRTNAIKVHQLALNQRTITSILDDTTTSMKNKQTILEATSEFLEYLHIENKIDLETYKERFYNVLKARSLLGKGEGLSIKRPINPDKSHKSRRVTLQSGSQYGYLQYDIGFRLAYHSFDDSDDGLLSGTQIEFFDILASYTPNNSVHPVAIEKATLLTLTSVAQHSTFFQPLSWRTLFGFNRNTINNQLEFQADVGAGYSFASSYGYTYLMVDMFSYFDRWQSMGASISGGFIWYEARGFKLNTEVTQRVFVDGQLQTLFTVSQLYSINAYVALKAHYEFIQQEYLNKQNAKLSLDIYF